MSYLFAHMQFSHAHWLNLLNMKDALENFLWLFIYFLKAFYMGMCFAVKKYFQAMPAQYFFIFLQQVPQT